MPTANNLQALFQPTSPSSTSHLSQSLASLTGKPPAPGVRARNTAGSAVDVGVAGWGGGGGGRGRDDRSWGARSWLSPGTFAWHGHVHTGRWGIPCEHAHGCDLKQNHSLPHVPGTGMFHATCSTCTHATCDNALAIFPVDHHRLSHLHRRCRHAPIATASCT